MKNMNKYQDLLEAIKFNLNALYEGVIDEADFVQAIEDEINQ